MNQPLYIMWKESSNLGVTIIDEQHRGIVSAINSLYYFVSLGKGYEALIPTLRIIEQYSILHFETEEKIMQQSRYPDFEKHVQLHRELSAQTRFNLAEAALHKEPAKALHFLKEWWMNHINHEDRQYSDWLAKTASPTD